MANPRPDSPKQRLRREMRRLLPNLGAGSPDVLARLGDWLDRHPAAHTLSAFAALPGEIDILPLIPRHPGRRWVFPRVEGDRLVLHQVTDPAADLEPGAFGILEPIPHLPTVDVFHVDAFLCPGLAFDDYGGRLGRGRGFYDRMLEHAKAGALKIGLCHPEQIVPHTFGEPHDIVMDEVIR